MDTDDSRKGQSGFHSFLRMAEQNKETIITASLLLYVAVYLVVGLGGVSFQLQPALAYLQSQSNSNAPAGALWVEGTDLHWADGSTEYYLDKTNSLVGDYHLDEGSGQTVNDYHSGNNNDGTLGSSTSSESSDPSWTSGKYDNALDFDGSDDGVTVDGGFEFSSPNQITLAAWAKLSAHSNYDGVVSGDVCCNYRIMIGDGDNELLYDPGSHNDQHITQTWSTGNWYHYAMTVQGGGQAKIYWNGDLIHSSSNGVPSTLPDESTFLIGTGEEFGAHPLNGIVDEVHIYNRVLNEWEIKQLYRGDHTLPGGGSSGAVWIEGSDLHWIGANGYEHLYKGSLATTSPGGSSGAVWIESGNLHYIDANGDERVADR